MNTRFNKRVAAVLAHFGWGPKEGTIVFRREDNGWRVGGGVVVTPWNVTDVPDDPEEALADIEVAVGIREPVVLDGPTGKDAMRSHATAIHAYLCRQPTLDADDCHDLLDRAESIARWARTREDELRTRARLRLALGLKDQP